MSTSQAKPEAKAAQTSGAVRAARAIQAQLGIPGIVDSLASIIDSETAAPDLLASLREYKETIRAGGVISLGMAGRASAAIAKAEGSS